MANLTNPDIYLPLQVYKINLFSLFLFALALDSLLLVILTNISEIPQNQNEMQNSLATNNELYDLSLSRNYL